MKRETSAAIEEHLKMNKCSTNSEDHLFNQQRNMNYDYTVKIQDDGKERKRTIIRLIMRFQNISQYKTQQSKAHEQNLIKLID